PRHEGLCMPKGRKGCCKYAGAKIPSALNARLIQSIVGYQQGKGCRGQVASWFHAQKRPAAESHGVGLQRGHAAQNGSPPPTDEPAEKGRVQLQPIRWPSAHPRILFAL